ncbi:MAG: hypothetical protein LUD16_03105 [Lachnospiraceae bacterium]|nr:hypothetical protein [Lachnospiraceae bacterium]
MSKLKKIWKVILFCLLLFVALPVNSRTAEAASKPAKPTLSKVANVTDGVQITWKEVSGATGYYVLRKTSSGSYKRLAVVSDGTAVTYTDTKAKDGKTYQYTVRAYNDNGTSGYQTGLSITRLATPTITGITSTCNSVTLSWTAVTGASTYKIYRKVGTSGSYSLYKKVKSTTTSYTDTSAAPDTRYTYKVIACKGSYKSAGATKSCKTLSGATVDTVDALYAIEADVKLTGSGTGYHAKLVAATATCAISYGIQFDNHAVAPYTGKAAFLVENVVTTSTGGQYYSRTGLSSVNKTYHLMLTVSEGGVCDFYVNYEKVGSETNASLAKVIKNGQPIYLRVEGSARINGDSVNAVFSNIRIKEKGSVVETPVISIVYLTGEGITSTASAGESPDKIVISGTLSGLADDQDWDSAADFVSGIIQYY